MADSTDDAVREWCERRGLKFKPWEVAPWDVDDGPSPWPPGSAGAESWPLAQRLRKKILMEIRQQQQR